MWRKGDPFVLCMGMWTGAATVERSMEIPQEIKNGLPYDPVIPLLGMYLKKPKTLIPRDINTPMFIAVLFAIMKMWKQRRCPSVDEWIKHLWDIYTMEYYADIKKKNIIPFAMV